MNPNVNMVNQMGGPVGGAPVPMMNNGAVNQQAAAAAAAANAANAAAVRQQQVNDQRCHLNTYIYEYFIRYGMYECARAVIASGQPVNVQKEPPKGSNVNGVSEDGMDTDMKDDPDSKHPEDLPHPKVPMPSDSSFLFEWFCLFWDIYNAQRTKGGSGNVNQYVAHTQQQLKQQELLRTMRPEGLTQQQYQQMIRMQQTGGMGMPLKPGGLVRAAMANNQNPGMMMHQAKHNQMQRDPSQMDPNRERQSSPASGENAPSPSKRQRPNDFNPNPAIGMMPNGRPGQPMPSQQMLSGPNAAAQMLAAHNINPGQMNAHQFQNFVNTPPTAQQKSIAAYSQHLQHHQGNQMGAKQPNAAGPQGQGSPMMAPGPDGSTMNYTYNTNGEIPTPNGLRGAAPANGQPGGGSNHALQDYQMQLMLLEQQNKKRLMMARQEQDNIGGVPREGQPPGAGGPGAPGGPGVPNGQPFPDASPQTMRTGASPNPTEQMKRGTPQMNNPGIPSPAPEGGPQSRGSPNPAMNFMGNPDPNMAPHFFKGADGSMAGAQAPMNGMRPPSSHPAPGFNGQMNQQMMAARQQAQGQQAGQNPQQWQQGPNGQMVPAQGMQQNQQVQGTPGQRSMPPPSAPVAAAANANNRTTASPQQAAAAPPTPNQSNKAAPKKKKDAQAAKDKRATAQKNKPNSNLNGSGATPAAESNGDSEQAAPATPITPVTAPGFKPGQNAGAANNQPNATSAAAPAPVPAPQAAIAPPQDPNSINMDSFQMDFGGPLSMGGDGIHTGDVLNDFDFDSFLHDGDGDNQPFDFNGAFSGMEGEIGAE